MGMMCAFAAITSIRTATSSSTGTIALHFQQKVIQLVTSSINAASSSDVAWGPLAYLLIILLLGFQLASLRVRFQRQQ
jgi:hypothetical protein